MNDVIQRESSLSFSNKTFECVFSDSTDQTTDEVTEKY